MNLKKLLLLLFLIVFCWVSSNIVYYGFVSSYNQLMFSRDSFLYLFNTGVFYYRILGKFLLLKWDDWIDPLHQNFYGAVFYFNTFWLLLTALMTMALVYLKDRFRLNEGERLLFLIVVPLAIDITQYVPVCYDILGYFLQLLIIYIFLKYYRKYFLFTTIAISLLLILSTLNRESSAITIAFLVVLIFGYYGFEKRDVFSICLFGIAFLGTYVGLRVILPPGAPDPQLARQLVGNLHLLINVWGLLFWLMFGTFTLLLANNTQNRRLILYFHAASLPYIYTVFTNGIPWETRLYIPIFLGSLFLSKLAPNQPHLRHPNAPAGNS